MVINPRGLFISEIPNRHFVGATGFFDLMVLPPGRWNPWGGVWNLSKPKGWGYRYREIKDATCRGKQGAGKHNTTCTQQMDTYSKNLQVCVWSSKNLYTLRWLRYMILGGS